MFLEEARQIQTTKFYNKCIIYLKKHPVVFIYVTMPLLVRWVPSRKILCYRCPASKYQVDMEFELFLIE